MAAEFTGSFEDLCKLINKNNKKTVVMFSSRSCGVCNILLGKFDEIRAEFSDFSFYQVDSNKNRRLVDRFNVKNVPHFVIFKQGDPNPDVIKAFTGSNLDLIRRSFEEAHL